MQALGLVPRPYKPGSESTCKKTIMAEIADPPVIVGQEYRVKLGKSFTFPKDNAFHTIKCKFSHLSDLGRIIGLAVR